MAESNVVLQLELMERASGLLVLSRFDDVFKSSSSFFKVLKCQRNKLPEYKMDNPSVRGFTWNQDASH